MCSRSNTYSLMIGWNSRPINHWLVEGRPVVIFSKKSHSNECISSFFVETFFVLFRFWLMLVVFRARCSTFTSTIDHRLQTQKDCDNCLLALKVIYCESHSKDDYNVWKMIVLQCSSSNEWLTRWSFVRYRKNTRKFSSCFLSARKPSQPGLKSGL